MRNWTRLIVVLSSKSKLDFTKKHVALDGKNQISYGTIKFIASINKAMVFIEESLGKVWVGETQKSEVSHP